MFEKKKTAGQLYGVLGHLMEDADSISEEDYKQYLANIKPGDTVEARGKIKAEDNKKRLLARAAQAREQIADLCAEAEREMGVEMAAAPSAEAVSYLNSLRGRKCVTRAEMEAAYRKYGDNWSIFSALKEFEMQQLKAGNNVACPQFSNTLVDGQKFLDKARKVADSFAYEVAMEAFKSEANRKAKTSFVFAQLNGFAEGRFGPEFLDELGNLAGEGEEA